MARYKITKTGYEIANNSYVDKRLVLTRNEMRTADKDFILPDYYFAYCPENGYEGFYYYSKDNNRRPDTGKYYRIDQNWTKAISDIFVNGKSVVEDDIASFNAIEDAIFRGASIVSEGIINLDILDDFEVTDVIVNDKSVLGEGSEKSIAFVNVPTSTSELENTGLKTDDGIQPIVVLSVLNAMLDSEVAKLNSEDSWLQYQIDQIVGSSETDNLLRLIQELRADLTSETDSRIFGDSELFKLFDSERLLRIKGDSELTLLLDSERHARIAADDSERQARIAADDSERLSRIKGDSELEGLLDSEARIRAAEDLAIRTWAISELAKKQNNLVAGDAIVLVNNSETTLIKVNYDSETLILNADKLNVKHPVPDYDNSVANKALVVNSEGTDLIWGEAGKVDDVKTGTVSRLVNKVAELPAMSKGTGTNAIVLGSNNASNSDTRASGTGAVAEGNSTIASGNYSHAEGQDTNATRPRAHAEGVLTNATGNNSHAEGESTTASGADSHAEGNGSRAAGANSHAEGTSTQANALSSHAEGSQTIATGNASHAEGVLTIADAAVSHVEGDSTKSTLRAQHVQGKYNADNNNAADIVGWGTSSGRKNISTLMTTGELHIKSDLYVRANDDGNEGIRILPIITSEDPGRALVLNSEGTQLEWKDIITADNIVITLDSENIRDDKIPTAKLLYDQLELKQNTLTFRNAITSSEDIVDVLFDNDTIILNSEGELQGRDLILPASLSKIRLSKLIPTAVHYTAGSSENNILVDEETLRGLISSNLGKFIGTYNSTSEIPLVDKQGNPVLRNDYAFVPVEVVTSEGAHMVEYWRYKFVDNSEGSGHWEFEYVVSGSAYTPSQWRALNSNWNSNLTNATVDHIDDLSIHVSSEDRVQWSDKQEKLTGEQGIVVNQSTKKVGHTNVITSGTKGSQTKALTVTYDANGHITNVTELDMYPPITGSTAKDVWLAKGEAQRGEWKTTHEMTFTAIDSLTSEGTPVTSTKVYRVITNA